MNTMHSNTTQADTVVLSIELLQTVVLSIELLQIPFDPFLCLINAHV